MTTETEQHETTETNETPSASRLPSHWRKILIRTNKHLLFSEDIGPVGTKIDVEIVDVTIEKVKNEDGLSDMPALSFAGAKKRFALNRTNCKALQKICDTEDPNLWRGWITLVVVQAKIAGEPTEAIRIAPKRPAGKVAK
jgi:hypothetical protein